MQRAECAQAVVATLQHFDGEEYLLGDYVVMSNHVHALVQPIGSHACGEIVAAWKSCSARRINAVLGRKGTVWMDESFDHLERSEVQLEKLRDYIRANPAKAGLKEGEYVWREAPKVWAAPPPAKG